MTDETLKITGLYGCSCHPFDSWEDLKNYNDQKIEIGAKYRIRHSGKECIAKEFNKDQKYYIHIFVEPYDCPRCNQIEHKQNLIRI